MTNSFDRSSSLKDILATDQTEYDVNGISLDQVARLSECDTVGGLQDKIEQAIENEYYISFGNAWRALRRALGYGDANFIRGESARLVATTFNQVVPGSDALLVNAQGEFGCDDATAVRHYQWLTENGYESLPKKKGGQRSGRSAPTL